MCLAARDIHDQARQQVAQIEAAIEAIGECGEVAVGMLGPGQRVERAVQRGLEIAEDRVDPLELRQFVRLAIPDHDGRMRAACRRHRREAGQAVADDQRRRRQTGLGSGLDGLTREAADAVELDELRTPLVVERDGGHERRFVLRAAPGLAARMLATQVGVIELNRASKPVLSLAQRHGVVDLVLQGPGGGIAHAQRALERERGHPGLGLAEQIDRKKPDVQRQLGVLEQAGHGQRGLVAAALTLEEFAGTVPDNPVLGGVAAQAAKATRPAGRLDGLGALVFSPETLDELRQRHAVLKLDGVEGHGLDSRIEYRQDYRPGSSNNELPAATYQSGFSKLLGPRPWDCQKDQSE